MEIFEEVINGVTFKHQMLDRKGYDSCEFIECTFSEADLADISFINCHFKTCDFRQSKMDHLGLKDVTFFDCNFTGVDFSVCSPFLWKAKFEACQMSVCNFTGMQLKGTLFKDCSLIETDFTESNLSSALFDSCDLHRAIFFQCILEKTNFTTAERYSFDPGKNTLKKTAFSSQGVKGLLSSFDIIIHE